MPGKSGSSESKANRKAEAPGTEAAGKADHRETISTALLTEVFLERSLDVIFTCEPNGVIGSWNRSAAELYGYSAEDAIGRTSQELLKTRKLYGPKDSQSELEDEGTGTGVVERQRRNGDLIEVESWREAIRTDRKALWLEISRSVTWRQRA